LSDVGSSFSRSVDDLFFGFPFSLALDYLFFTATSASTSLSMSLSESVDALSYESIFSTFGSI
jgi:hypothetical protein